MLSCSKGSRGLFVPSRVIGIFTDTTISLESRLRQCPDHYTIRAGRNLPDNSISHSPVFLVNSCLDRFAAPHSREDPFSRSYGVILPSSLTVNLPSALVCSTRPRVSVCGTGARHVECLADFLGSLITFAFAQPGGFAYYRLSARTVDFPAILCTYGLQRPFPSGRGSVTSPSPHRHAGQ